MRSAKAGLLLVSLLVACCAAGPLLAQEEPLTAGSDGVPVPKKTKHVQPAYPAEALAQGIRGIVILDIVIDAAGKVASTSVLRSVPGLDEAAIAAARQWEYEPTKVKDKPVSVRVTVPITFSLALPRITRQTGIPELRQGVSPAFPQAGGATGAAAVEVTLEPDGRIADARLVSGEAPWSEALMAAIRTWRFSSPPEDAVVSFRVEAEFTRANGANPSAVQLRATGLQRTELLAGAGARPEHQAPAAGTPQAPAAAAPGAGTPQAQAPAPPAAEPPQQAAPVAPVQPQPAPTPTPAPVPSAPAPQAKAPQAPTPAPVPAQPTPGTPLPGAPTSRSPAAVGGTPAPVPDPPQGRPPAAGAAPVDAPATEAAPPPIEVLTAPPPAPPAESGISAIRDVTLEPGVPELARGRRPVAPPIARLSGSTGAVEVSFSVGAGGNTALQTAAGPDILRFAAEQTVTTWVFRRTRAERAYLVAVFTYDGDKATAVVRPQAASAPTAPGSDVPPPTPAAAAQPSASAAQPSATPQAQPAASQPPPGR